MRGVYLRLSRSHPKFLEKLFEMEVPEIKNGAVLVKAIAREAGGRSKIAVAATDERIDPVGALVGQRGVRVSTVMSELGGERIDIIEFSANQATFIEDALSPARVLSVVLNEAEHRATVEVSEDQQSLAIGRGGQNVRLAAKLTGWSIDIRPVGGVVPGEDAEAAAVPHEEVPVQAEGALEASLEEEEGAVQPPEEAVASAETTEVGKSESEAVAEAPSEMDAADEAEEGAKEK
jgi:N utilization substance protein A